MESADQKLHLQTLSDRPRSKNCIVGVQFVDCMRSMHRSFRRQMGLRRCNFRRGQQNISVKRVLWGVMVGPWVWQSFNEKSVTIPDEHCSGTLNLSLHPPNLDWDRRTLPRGGKKEQIALIWRREKLSAAKLGAIYLPSAEPLTDEREKVQSERTRDLIWDYLFFVCISSYLCVCLSEWVLFTVYSVPYNRSDMWFRTSNFNNGIDEMGGNECDTRS